jgi:hypothetical protein
MIWPFKDDLLERDAALLVGAANTHAIIMFSRFTREFPSIPDGEREAKYWYFVVTIAAVFLALIRLRTLDLNGKRRLKLEKKVAERLVRLYPRFARAAFEHCKSFFDKYYYDFLEAGYDPLLIAYDTIGTWVALEILRHPPNTEEDFKFVRLVGEMIYIPFFNWWEKDNQVKAIALSTIK